MINKIQFAIFNYSLLALFACSCFGLGVWVVRSIRSFSTLDKMFAVVLTIGLGLGVHILSLQILGALGLLTKSYIAGLLSLGMIGFAFNLFVRLRHSDQIVIPVVAKQHWFFHALLCVLAIELFAKPLRPAIGWDELMYHLPHAREWASAGKLTINEWLRYPLFPYNFNLLYAEGLIFGNETFPHMVHAFAGCLVALGIYRLALIYFDGVIASITAFLFVILALGQFGTAYIDLGLSLFIFLGISSLFFWYEKKDNGYIYVAMFLLGVAAGIKYQALIFTPFFAIVILLRERRPTRLLLMLALFLLPCIYWYVRNYFISGDPFHPLGAKLFGYWGWNAKDMEAQFADIKRVADWPNWCVWPAIGAIFMRSKMNYLPFRAALLISIYSFFVWMFTSHYSRYLLPAYPFIALLSAVVLRSMYQRLVLEGGESSEKSRKKFMLENGLASLILGLLLILVIPSFGKHWKKVQVGSSERSAYLRNEIASFEIGEFLQSHPEYRLVQLGLESDLYYLPPNTIGDVFGPGRYDNFYGIPSAELAHRVRKFGANALLLSKENGYEKIRDSDAFLEYFVLIKDSPKAELYGLKQVY
jgi:hypothetical protein